MVEEGKQKLQRVAALGNFDGVHKGHALLLEATKTLAQKLGATSAAVVFDPHPRRFFQPDTPPFLLTLSHQRDDLLRAKGIEHVIRLPFNEALSRLSPDEFVEKVLRRQLGLAGVVTGAEFRFGAKRAGDAATLASLCAEYGMKALAIEPQTLDGTATHKIGSSGVRDAIVNGDMARAETLLGRYWTISGKVVEGQQLGRTLNFPTANIMLGEYVEPKNGVYAVKCYIDGICHGGVANYGRRPTVGASEPLLEVHLLDFDGDLYGQFLEVSFIDFIRDEKKFDGLDALKAQIQCDSDRARCILENDTGNLPSN